MSNPDFTKKWDIEPGAMVGSASTTVSATSVSYHNECFQFYSVRKKGKTDYQTNPINQ